MVSNILVPLSQPRGTLFISVKFIVQSIRFCKCGCILLILYRPDVEITSLIEKTWKNRSSDILKDVPWTYVGTQSGVFRSYPGHRSRKLFDPTK